MIKYRDGKPQKRICNSPQTNKKRPHLKDPQFPPAMKLHSYSWTTISQLRNYIAYNKINQGSKEPKLYHIALHLTWINFINIWRLCFIDSLPLPCRVFPIGIFNSIDDLTRNP